MRKPLVQAFHEFVNGLLLVAGRLVVRFELERYRVHARSKRG